MFNKAVVTTTTTIIIVFNVLKKYEFLHFLKLTVFVI